MNARAASAFRKRAADELQDIVVKAEELLESLASEGGDTARDLRARAGDTLRTARKSLGKLDKRARETARYYAETTDDYVHDNPWSSIAVGAAVGLIVGALLSRRS